MDSALLPEFDSSERFTSSDARKIGVMHQKYGKRQPERRCGECAHFLVYKERRTYFKCEVFGESNGPGTDWRKKWPACGRFERVEA